MKRLTFFCASAFMAAATLAACGNDGDRESLIEDRLRIGNSQEQAECIADAVIEEFGGDPGADGVLEDGDTEKLLSITFDCVGGAEG